MSTVSRKAYEIAHSLAAVAGPEHVRSKNDTVAVSPASTEQIADILRFANEQRLGVVPYGAGTKQGWGNPAQPGLILCLDRLDAVREHTWHDMTATVQAGCKWSLMQAVLAEHGQFVALDPLWPDYATVGGIVAVNDNGALRLKYGGLRDLIIGMQIVLADGTIARTGGKVVKNVAGYDLQKLMIGALGTLGIITEVTFRLHAIPPNTQSFTIFSPTAGTLQVLFQKVLDSYLSSQSIQLRTLTAQFALDIRLAASPEALNDQAALLVTMARDLGLAVEESGPEAWNARQETAGRVDMLTVKATMLPSQVSYFSEIVNTFGGISVVQGTGIMTACFPPDPVENLLRFRSQIESAGGSLTILGQPAPAELDVWGSVPDSYPLMCEIKRRFDPHRILNPGHFLGGI